MKTIMMLEGRQDGVETRESGKPQDRARELPELDWNFDSVSDDELVACCYWEYARESAFLRELRQRCYESYQSDGSRDSELHADLQRVQAIGQLANHFLCGFFRPPEDASKDETSFKRGVSCHATGCFPKPWQAINKQERDYRTRLPDFSLPAWPMAFERGTASDARWIAEWAESRRYELDEMNARARRRNPRLAEHGCRENGELLSPNFPPRLIYRSGREVTVVYIDWGAFTNEQIIQCFRKWVRDNRPADLPAPSRRGHKPGDWRAQLVRLAAMRLLSRYTPKEILGGRNCMAMRECRVIRETKQFASDKWIEAAKWRDARREAGRVFHAMFPFLPAAERPLSWERGLPGK